MANHPVRGTITHIGTLTSRPQAFFKFSWPMPGFGLSMTHAASIGIRLRR